MKSEIIFVCGMVGAIAPEIVRLYSIRNEPSKFEWSSFYLVASVLFTVLGGFMAWVMPAVNYFGAFYVGISTPVLINSLIEKSMNALQPQLKGVGPHTYQKYNKVQSFIRGL
jgi:hypothetical protein